MCVMLEHERCELLYVVTNVIASDVFRETYVICFCFGLIESPFMGAFNGDFVVMIVMDLFWFTC